MISRVYAALVHAPVRNRAGEEIAASANEYDFVDSARLMLTYPVRRFLVVQPLPAQQALVQRLIAHGLAPDRDVEQTGRFEGAALVDTLDEAIAAATADAGARPTVVATTARRWPDAVPYPALRARVESGEPTLVLFGKAWGLAESVVAGADVRLAPIEGGGAFNHLSVRSAMAIVLDRLLGR